MNKKLRINSSFLDNIVDILLEQDIPRDCDVVIGIKEHDIEFVVDTDIKIKIINKEK